MIYYIEDNHRKKRELIEAEHQEVIDKKDKAIKKWEGKYDRCKRECLKLLDIIEKMEGEQTKQQDVQASDTHSAPRLDQAEHLDKRSIMHIDDPENHNNSMFDPVKMHKTNGTNIIVDGIVSQDHSINNMPTDGPNEKSKPESVVSNREDPPLSTTVKQPSSFLLDRLFNMHGDRHVEIRPKQASPPPLQVPIPSVPIEPMEIDR